MLLLNGSPKQNTSESQMKCKQIYIKNLVIRMDPKTIKDLQSVFSVIREIEDYADGCGEGPDDEPEFM